MAITTSLSTLKRHLNVKTIKFDVDLEKVYLIPTLGPCFKTKEWDYFIPIYGDYEAVEIKFIDENNDLEVFIIEDSDSLQFYRKEFATELFKWNAKISYMEFKISPIDRDKYGI